MSLLGAGKAWAEEGLGEGEGPKNKGPDEARLRHWPRRYGAASRTPRARGARAT